MKILSRIAALFECVHFLGFRFGWKYWRIQSKAIDNPFIALEWADKCEREAIRLYDLGHGKSAWALSKWAEELRHHYYYKK